MGLIIDKNDKGQYKLTSTVSNESLHPDDEWIDEDEAKRILIYRQLHTFIEKSIEIEMTFPNGYRVNDSYQRDTTKPDFHRWFLDALKSDNVDEIIKDKFEEVYNRLKLEIKIP